MKRHNIYLYEYISDEKGKNAGFCRMDIHNNVVKILINISNKEMGIVPNDIVEIKSELVFKSGKKQEFVCDSVLLHNGNLAKVVHMDSAEEVVGIELLYKKKNGLSICVAGWLGQRVKIEQVELEDTVYNVDTECVKNSENDNKRNVKKLSILEVTSLPRECWKIARNKFVLCGCNRYGHLTYIEENDRKIIGVPGKMDDNIAICAKRYGFTSYVKADILEEDTDVEGYWVMNVASNGK